MPDTVLEIIAQGAWNGGNRVDNSIYENKGLMFKGGIPVNNKTIEERIGVRTRVVAREDERIGVLAFQDLLQTSDIDPSRIKLVIGATNIGEDKWDSGPLIRHPFQLIQGDCPDALVFDLYAGCPGFNASVELVVILSLTGLLLSLVTMRLPLHWLPQEVQPVLNLIVRQQRWSSMPVRILRAASQKIWLN